MATATKKKPKKKMGRPTDYTVALAKEICDKMVACGSLKKAIKENKSKWPAETTIYQWIYDMKHPDFTKQYETARKVMVERYLDETIDIAEETPQIVTTIFGSKDQEAQVTSTDSAGIARNRLRVDIRKFFMTKILPKMRETQDLNVTVLNVDRLAKARERVLNDRDKP